ncbi:hypothetical protein [Mycobacterium sp.]
MNTAVLVFGERATRSLKRVEPMSGHRPKIGLRSYYPSLICDRTSAQ